MVLIPSHAILESGPHPRNVLVSSPQIIISLIIPVWIIFEVDLLLSAHYQVLYNLSYFHIHILKCNKCKESCVLHHKQFNILPVIQCERQGQRCQVLLLNVTFHNSTIRDLSISLCFLQPMFGQPISAHRLAEERLHPCWEGWKHQLSCWHRLLYTLWLSNQANEQALPAEKSPAQSVSQGKQAL